MALNFSHRPIFPPHLPEESSVQGGSHDRDICELLPADPFGMDISSTVTAITGWLEDLGADYVGHRSADVGVGRRDYPVFANWNFWLNTAAIEFQSFPGYQQFGDRMTRDAGVSGSGFSAEKELGCSGYDWGGFQVSCALDGAKYGTYNARGSFEKFDDYGNNSVGFDFRRLKEELDRCPMYDGGVPFASVLEGANLGSADAVPDENDNGNHGKNVEVLDGGNVNFNRGKNVEVLDDGHGKVNHEKNVEVLDDDDGAPHSAMRYALPYLGVRDWLSIELVCKSLRQTVKTELLYSNIHIDQPLNDRITDDVLLQLTKKADGELQCLSLVECQRITDDGLRRVLNANPKLVKLSVPGCTRLSIDGVVNSLRAFQMVAVTGIRCLRVGGLFGVTETHFEELVSLLGIDNNHIRVNHHKPHFYHRGNIYLSCEDDRPIDIEVCPRCQNLRLVYDCPAECCQSKDDATPLCRACTLCIPRCVQCGKCINDSVYEETFLLELRCSDCLNPESLPQERLYMETSSCEHDTSQEEPVVSFHG